MTTVNLTDEINGNTAESKEGGVVCSNDNLGLGLWGGLTIPHASQLNFSTGNCSFSFWFKTGSDVTKTFVRGTKGSWGTGPAIRFGVFYDAPSLSIQIYAWFDDTTKEAKAIASAALTASSWYHVVFVFDRTETSMHQIYLNGSLLTNDVEDSYDAGVETSDFDNSEDLDIIAIQTQDDVLSNTQPTSFSDSSAQSISLWMKARGYFGDSLGNPYIGLNNMFSINALSSIVQYYFAMPDLSRVFSIPSDEDWHHYVITMNTASSPVWNVYIDGSSDSTYATIGESYANQSLFFEVEKCLSFDSGIAALISGASATIDGGTGDLWIDELQYYSRELDASDVTALYTEATATTQRTGCVARYAFEDGNWDDSSGNGNDLAITHPIVPGKFGKCMHIGLSRLELDEIQIYNRALSASEVLQLYGV